MILIGELRDTETAHTALQAAESGHLVFSTLHTIDAAETIGRMIEFFPPAKQQQIRSILAGTLRGVISQRLLPRVEGGRVASVEVMVTNARIQDLIREDRPDEITDAIAAGEYFQMQTFAQSLIELVLTGDVDRDVAANAADESPRLPRRARAGREATGRGCRDRGGREWFLGGADRSSACYGTSLGSPSPIRGLSVRDRMPDDVYVGPSFMLLSAGGVVRRLQRALRREHGFTLIEAVLAMAIFLGVSTALAGVLTGAISARTVATERTAAEQVANDQLEWVRSLAYADVGLTTNGNPSGDRQPERESVGVRWSHGSCPLHGRDQHLLGRRPRTDGLLDEGELQERRRHRVTDAGRKDPDDPEHPGGAAPACRVRRHQPRNRQRPAAGVLHQHPVPGQARQPHHGAECAARRPDERRR